VALGTTPSLALSNASFAPPPAGGHGIAGRGHGEHGLPRAGGPAAKMQDRVGEFLDRPMTAEREQAISVLVRRSITRRSSSGTSGAGVPHTYRPASRSSTACGLLDAARRPSAGAVPGRWGACLAVRTPPAAFLCFLFSPARPNEIGTECAGACPGDILNAGRGLQTRRRWPSAHRRPPRHPS
jgi:hypothetical protein